MRRLLLAFVFSAFALTANAATLWWVDPVHGSDSNDGLSIASAFLTLQHAESGHAIAGDTVYGLSGTYLGSSTTTDVLDIFTSGLSGRPITWQCYPGPPKQACIIAAQAQTHVVHIAGNYVTFENWEIAGPAQTITLAAALTNAASTTWNTSGLYNGTGLMVDNNGAGGTTHHVIVQNNRIHDFAAAGIDVGASDYVNVIGNVVYNCANWSPFASSCITTFGNKALDSNGYINITGNTAYNGITYMPNTVDYNTNSGFLGIPITPTASNTYPVGTTTIQISTTNAPSGAVHAITPVTAGMAIYDVTTPGALAKFTIITTVTSGTPGTVTFNNTGATATINSGDTLLIGFMSDGECFNMDDEEGSNPPTTWYRNPINVTNNLAFGCGSAGFQSFRNWNTRFSFNTAASDMNVPSSLIENYSVGEIYINSDFAGGPGSTIVGNIVVPSSNAKAAWGTYVPGGSPAATWSCNLQYGGSNTLPGSGNISGNPLFVNPWNGSAVNESDLTVNFQILPGSPAEDAACGSQYVTFPTTDILGNPRPAGPGTDMGAFEE